MIKVLMADDHAILRHGLKQLFVWAGDIVVAAEAINGKEVLEYLHKEKFDILLLDMAMPAPSGVDLIAQIYAKAIHLPILVLTMHNDTQIAKKALQAGASGYLTKDSEPEVMLAAVRQVAAGGRYVTAAIAQQLGSTVQCLPLI